MLQSDRTEIITFCLTHNPNLSLPLGEMSCSDREGWLLLWGSWIAALRQDWGSSWPACFFRFTLIRVGQNLTLSVICFANASSPKGRVKKPLRTARQTNQSSSHANFLACCSFRHGLRRATFLKEEGFLFVVWRSDRFVYKLPKNSYQSVDLRTVSQTDGMILKRQFFPCHMPFPVFHCVVHHPAQWQALLHGNKSPQ